MRQSSIHKILVCLLGVLVAAPVSAAKIKHQTTLYADGANLALKLPEGVACNDKSIVVADTANNRLVRYALTAQSLTPEAVFPLPEMVPLTLQSTAAGDIYLLNGKTRDLVKVSPRGEVQGKVEPKGLPAPSAFVPRSFKLDRAGNIYLLDILSERVLVLDPSASYVRHLPFPEGYGFFSDLALSPQGGIYLLDSVAGALYLAAPDAQSFALLNGDLKEYVNFATSLASDGRGDLYLVDQYGSGLAVVGGDGSFKGRKFGMGWEDGQFFYPAQICINEQGTLVVADRNNNRVQVFNILED